MLLQKLTEKSSPIPKLRREAALGIAIKSGYRGIGIGTQIMKTLINESRKAGLKILVLNVFNTNKTARQLYEKMGFKETGKTPKYFYKDGRYIDEIHMVLEL